MCVYCCAECGGLGYTIELDSEHGEMMVRCTTCWEKAMDQFAEQYEEMIADELDAIEWAECCRAQLAAESNHFERFQPHVDDMDMEDRMGLR